jgi:arsenate reductase
MNVLALCTGNACRSQMMQGFLEQNENINAYSAGVEIHGVNPRAVKVMAEAGIDISNHTSNHVDEYKDVNFDVVITVCDNAKERCPLFPAKAKKIHHRFPDPAGARGTEAEILEEFRKTRDMIKEFCDDLKIPG